MSTQSDRVKRWRNRLKERIIHAMGGSCVCCGYNKSTWALALHHLDPSEKDFNFGEVRASPKSWAKVITELRKCVLVCHNCHSEIHNGVTKLPEKFSRFNETVDFATYDSFVSNENKLRNKSAAVTSTCPACGKTMAYMRKYCSNSCSATQRGKVDWAKIDLPKLLVDKTYQQLAEELGCSDAAIHKRMIKLGLKERSNRQRTNL